MLEMFQHLDYHSEKLFQFKIKSFITNEFLIT